MAGVNITMEVGLRGVISKALIGEIMGAVHTAAPRLIYTDGSKLDFSSIVDFLSDYLQELQETKHITTYDVICDSRNNDPSTGRTHVVIDCSFRQYNCLINTLIKIKFTAAE